ncbi:DnaJ domain-containing protein [Sulfurimonas aquatica]|uniref:DnaJ domain-containing protein n=1 Tax=Sulfurimonas aquatica TaxID=2672570 RepID=A0A975B0W7_9BACT|nr:DnaJ domain-containing protein [Sulfurimonas aquatica]QSZ42100.1 DnaJ domain-containing protein [Sulfurimonas aquatica]
MKKFVGFLLIALGIFLEVMWLGFCFGSIIIGILLLVFAPRILFFPFNFFLVVGLSVMGKQAFSGTRSFKYGSYSQGGSSHSNRGYTQSVNNFDKYYEILESSKTDGMDVIKKNYRRLMKAYHYDSIASKDLPEHMIKLAEEKTKSLNEAYSAIKAARS